VTNSFSFGLLRGWLDGQLSTGWERFAFYDDLGNDKRSTTETTLWLLSLSDGVCWLTGLLPFFVLLDVYHEEEIGFDAPMIVIYTAGIVYSRN